MMPGKPTEHDPSPSAPAAPPKTGPVIGGKEGTKPPLVSVIIPAFNVQDFIREALQSVFAQSLKDYEVIVVDDGSSDSTLEVVETIRCQTQWHGIPFTVLSQTNRGQSSAQNRALRMARGKYVAVLDSDDRWHPHYLARQVANIEEQGDALDLSCCGFRLIDETGRPLNKEKRFSAQRISLSELFVRGGLGTASLVLVRREAAERIGGFDQNLRTSTDLDFCLRIAALRPNNMGCLSDVLVDYRVHPMQTTRKWPLIIREWETVLGKLRQFAPEVAEAHENAARARKFYQCATLAQRSGARKDSLVLLTRAWMQSPSALLSWIALRHTLQYAFFAGLPASVAPSAARALKRLRS